ncbi:MAG: single-stranded DNA-binding protein, partial [Gammaproteobacteria bacterium]|nr:single-stranded DNA-binding protein [Gammaproteobacteria bacterium]
GRDRYTTEIVASEMQMLGSRSGAGAPAQAASGGGAPAPANDQFDDDIPF